MRRRKNKLKDKNFEFMISVQNIYGGDPLPVAIHEVGHATVQSLLGVGPQSVRITRVDGGWEGQALPSEDALDDQKRVRTYVAQLAGPIAQIVCAPVSLKKYIDYFRDGLLLPAFDCLRAGDADFSRLGWLSDLKQVIHKANQTRNTWRGSDFEMHRQGGFLHSSEVALFEFFRNELVIQFVIDMGKSLSQVEFIDGAAFIAESHARIPEAAQKRLGTLNLNFPAAF